MIQVYLSSVREIGPRDINGASSFAIGERESLVYEGGANDAADYLERCVSVGVSVAVRYPGGLRSCMNKPSLWADIRAIASEGN